MYQSNFAPFLLGSTLVACSGEPEPSAEPGGPAGGDATDTGSGVAVIDPCGAVPADDAGYAELFDASRVHAVAFTLEEGAAAAIAAAPEDEVVAAVDVDGHAFSGVGLRWRGEPEEQRWDGKPGFRVDLRALTACETFAGVRRLAFDAMTVDPAQGRQVIESAVLTAAGAEVPLATWARVSVNGEDFGLYAMVEAVDAPFVVHHWPDPGGVLWEGERGADFTDLGVEEWDDVDSTGDRDDLRAIAEVAAEAGDDYYARLGELVDTDSLLTTWGMLTAIGEDGPYPFDTDDVYAYAAPGDGRLRFVPWNLGGGWDPEFAWERVEGILGVRCVYDEACAADMEAHVRDALDAVSGVDVAGVAAAAFAVSDEAMREDPRRAGAEADVVAAREALLVTVGTWTATVGP